MNHQFGGARHQIARLFMRAVGRLGLSFTIGLALGTAVWVVAMMNERHSLAAALREEVEDGLGLLEGLVALGGFCGAVVGLGWGVQTVMGSPAERGATPDHGGV